MMWGSSHSHPKSDTPPLEHLQWQNQDSSTISSIKVTVRHRWINKWKKIQQNKRGSGSHSKVTWGLRRKNFSKLFVFFWMICMSVYHSGSSRRRRGERVGCCCWRSLARRFLKKRKKKGKVTTSQPHLTNMLFLIMPQVCQSSSWVILVVTREKGAATALTLCHLWCLNDWICKNKRNEFKSSGSCRVHDQHGTYFMNYVFVSATQQVTRVKVWLFQALWIISFSNVLLFGVFYIQVRH